MYFKTFDKLDMETKVEILSENDLVYDLSSESGYNALKREFKLVESMIRKSMIEKGLYKIRLNIKRLNQSMKEYNKLSEELQTYYNEKTKDNLFFAFGFSENEVIDKLENEYNLNINDIVSVGYGGYIKKSYVKEWNELNNYILERKREFVKDRYNACGLFLNRLWDYESRISFGEGYTDSLNDLMGCMGVKKIDDDKLLDMLNATIDYYNREFDKINGYY